MTLMRMIQNATLATSLVIGLGFANQSFAEKTKSSAKAKKVTFEQCCQSHDNDSAKCHATKGVRGKKAKSGKKWVKKECPKPTASNEVIPDGAIEESAEEAF